MRIGTGGTGWVGSSIAISTLHSGVANELLLSDVRFDVAEGEGMDLAHGASFYAPARVRAVAIEEMASADAVVVTAGRGSGPGESRLALLRDNAAIVRQIALDPRSIHAQVVGEHGDSEVVLWSSARVGGVPLRRWPDWSPGREESVANEIRGAAYEIIRRKGATNHAIGLVTAALLRWSLRGERRALTVSRVQEGALGLRDVALSLPSVVGTAGAVEVLEPELEPGERKALLRSAGVLSEAWETL